MIIQVSVKNTYCTQITTTPFLLITASSSSLFDLLLLQLNRLVIDKHALALVRLRRPPLAHLARKAHEHLTVGALEQDARQRRRRHRHAPRDAHLDGVREAQLEAEELLAGELLLGAALLDAGAVADADEAQDGCVAFGDARDVVAEVGPRGAYINQTR